MTHASPLRQAGVLGIFLLAVFLAAACGGAAVVGVADTYAALAKPSWAPPGWLFGPVWTVLYIGIAVSGWWIWRQSGWSRIHGLWALQLLLNTAWTPLFFGLGQRTLALVDILALDVLVGTLVVLSFRRSRFAGALLVPYLLWALFATALNASIVMLNP